MNFITKSIVLLTVVLFSNLFNIEQAYAQKSIFDLSSNSLFTKQNDDFVDVDEAFQFDFEQTPNTVIVKFKIKKGYYLYRHQFKFPVTHAEIAEVALPIGIEHEDEFFGVQQIYEDELSFPITIIQAGDNASLKIRYQGCAKKGLCYPPQIKKITLPNFTASASINTSDSSSENTTNAILNALNKTATPNNTAQTPAAAHNQSTTAQKTVSKQNQLADMLKQDSLWLTLIAFFMGGLLLAFTPCVFPMYPILTGIIVGQGNNLTSQKAFTLSFFYVQGMAVTYTILGVVVALAGAQFQAAFQHPYVLIGLSVLFIFLALSMFGIFNLALPSSWQNKLNAISGKQQGGSVMGVTIMGIISGLVASPCTTAPLTGALLYISQTGNVLLGASALYALSLGMGLPLLILGSSGGKLLPKAGNWMNIIKNIFGLLLLAVPIFLLERFIPEVITKALWITLLLISASYFYVVNQNSNNTKGFWYGARSLIVFIMLFFGTIQAYFLIFPQQISIEKSNEHKNSFIKVTTLAELTQAVNKANNQGKTVMVDLYADWCVACKEFEQYTFYKPQVQKALTNTVLLQIDLTDTNAAASKALMSHYKILGLPSILFFNLQGEELTQQRVTGFMAADEFAAHINTLFKNNLSN